MYKRRVKLLLGLIIFIMSLIAICNYIIDPFSYFGTNFIKNKAIENAEKIKLQNVIKHTSIDTLILGSSRSMKINPYDISPNSFNLAVNNATIFDMSYFLNFIINNNINVKEVYIGIDFNMFNKSWIKNTNRYSNLDDRNIGEYGLIIKLFSLSSIKASYLTLYKWWNAIKSTRVFDQNGYLIDYTKNKNFKYSIIDLNNIYSKYYKYIIDEKSLETLNNIVEKLNVLNIKYKLFLTPLYIDKYNQLNKIEILEKNLQIIRQNLRKYKYINLMELSKYNSERIYFDDEFHTTETYGRIIVQKLKNEEIVDAKKF